MLSEAIECRSTGNESHRDQESGPILEAIVKFNQPNTRRKTNDKIGKKKQKQKPAKHVRHAHV